MSLKIKETHNNPATLGTKLHEPNTSISQGNSLDDIT